MTQIQDGSSHLKGSNQENPSQVRSALGFLSIPDVVNLTTKISHHKPHAPSLNTCLSLGLPGGLGHAEANFCPAILGPPFPSPLLPTEGVMGCLFPDMGVQWELFGGPVELLSGRAAPTGRGAVDNCFFPTANAVTIKECPERAPWVPQVDSPSYRG